MGKEKELERELKQLQKKKAKEDRIISLKKEIRDIKYGKYLNVGTKISKGIINSGKALGKSLADTQVKAGKLVDEMDERNAKSKAERGAKKVEVKEDSTDWFATTPGLFERSGRL